ncbi:transposase [Salinibacter sp.]|uniref:transposase n=1 Tax=Salinibacter sp. TaxID=2065818 RepID=UPI002342D37A
MGFLKGKLAINIFKSYPQLKEKPYWGNHFWARGYFVNTVGMDEDLICGYVRYQEEEEKKRERQRGGGYDLFSRDAISFQGSLLGLTRSRLLWEWSFTFTTRSGLIGRGEGGRRLPRKQRGRLEAVSPAPSPYEITRECPARKRGDESCGLTGLNGRSILARKNKSQKAPPGRT